MLSCCAFAQAALNIFVSRSWQFYRSKHRHSLMNNGKSDQSACDMINGKKNANYVRIRRFNFDSACAGLSVSAANINLCGDKERILLDFSAYDVIKHLSTFGYVHCY